MITGLELKVLYWLLVLEVLGLAAYSRLTSYTLQAVGMLCVLRCFRAHRSLANIEKKPWISFGGENDRRVVEVSWVFSAQMVATMV
jgi:hypothetical protein